MFKFKKGKIRYQIKILSKLPIWNQMKLLATLVINKVNNLLMDLKTKSEKTIIKR